MTTNRLRSARSGRTPDPGRGWAEDIPAFESARRAPDSPSGRASTVVYRANFRRRKAIWCSTACSNQGRPGSTSKWSHG
ncbi:hypothetical protein GCM10025787_44450 [Saccharopolyspora rosea]